MKNLKILAVTVLLLISLGFLTNTQINAKNLSPNVKSLIKYAKKNEADNAIKIYKSLKNNETESFYQYLEQNPGDLPPIYFIIVADKVFETDKDKAVFFYNFGKVRAREDVLMCKDKSAGQQIMMYGMFAPNTLGYMREKASDFDYVNNLYLNIIEWDKKYSERVNPVWACYHGISAFHQKPELLPKEEFEKIQNDTHNELRNAAQKIQEYKKRQENNN